MVSEALVKSTDKNWRHCPQRSFTMKKYLNITNIFADTLAVTPTVIRMASLMATAAPTDTLAVAVVATRCQTLVLD
jgi:hypothetical protein